MENKKIRPDFVKKTLKDYQEYLKEHNIESDQMYFLLQPLTYDELILIKSTDANNNFAFLDKEIKEIQLMIQSFRSAHVSGQIDTYMSNLSLIDKNSLVINLGLGLDNFEYTDEEKIFYDILRKAIAIDEEKIINEKKRTNK